MLKPPLLQPQLLPFFEKRNRFLHAPFPCLLSLGRPNPHKVLLLMTQSQFLEYRTRLLVLLQCRQQFGRYLRHSWRSIRLVPTTIDLGRPDYGKSGLGHPACFDQSPDPLLVYFRPLANFISRCKLAGILRVVDFLDETIDPPKTKRFIESAIVIKRLLPSPLLIENQPDLFDLAMILLEPLAPVFDGFAEELGHVRCHTVFIEYNAGYAIEVKFSRVELQTGQEFLCRNQLCGV
jgi:hypothetical protein